MRSLLLALPAAGVLLAGSAPAAQAGGVAYQYDFRDYHGQPINYGATLAFTGAGGENNDLTVTFADGRYTFHDSGAPLSADDDCKRVDPNTVTCGANDGGLQQNGELGDYAGVESVGIDLGDGDDRASSGDFAVGVGGSVHGGPGNDTLGLTGPGPYQPPLFGDEGDDVITGGDNYDLLVGGPGADTLEGGPGDDLLGDDGNEGDRYVGGDGADRVSYDGAPTRLRIDLATGRGPDGDTYEGVEGAVGGPKDDTILGSPAANDLAGGPGRDMVLGRGGPDTIEGGVGEDSVNGNGGDDAIYATEPNGDARERVRCGSGDDLVASHDRDDLLARDCERRLFGRAGNQLTFQPLHIRGTRLEGLALTCSPKAPAAGCSARIVVAIGAGKRSLVLARGTLRAGPGETGAAPFRLIPTFALARGDHRVTIEVKLKARRTYRGSIRTFARN